ncbi:MAG: CHAT domain-containing protein [Balneolaceae bacterium]|nr:CHAT domain-containing protein [Balneolaceae bacterium]
MLLIAFIFSFFQLQGEVNQADYYLNQIARDNNVVENAWALNELIFSTCKSLNELSGKLQSSPLADVYSNIQCNEDDALELSGLKAEKLRELSLKLKKDELYILYLIDATELNPNPDSYTTILSNLQGRYAQLGKAIVNKEQITPELLPYDDHFLIHFALLRGTHRGDYYTADYLKKALTVWEKSEELLENKDLKYGAFLASTFVVSYLQDRHDLIHKFHDNFIELDIFPNIYSKLRVLKTLDYGLYTLGYYDRALLVQRRQTIPLAQILNRPDEIHNIKVKQGAYLSSLGKYQESKKVYEDLYNNSQYSHKKYIILNNLGLNYLALGEHNKYLNFLLKALNEDIPQSKYKSLLNIYRNLFLYYTSIKDVNTALNYIEKAKEVASSHSDTTELALIDSYLGSFYWTTYQDHEKALTFFNKSSQILTPKTNYIKYVDLLLEKTNIYTEIDSLHTALELLNTIKELALSKSNTPIYINVLINEAAAYLKLGNFQQVAQIFEEIQIYSLNDVEFDLLSKYYTIKSDYYYQTGSTQKAIDELEPVVEQIVERAKNNTDSQSGYWSVKDEYLDAFSLLTKMMMESGLKKKAISLLDQLKTINDASLYNNPLVKGAKLSEAQLAEEKRLNKSLQELRKNYLNAPSSDRFKIKTQIDQISAKREEILNTANLNKEYILSPLWAIQRQIAKNELVLHFTEVANQMYVSYLSFEEIDVRIISLTKEEQELLTQTADELASGKTDLAHLYAVYQILDLDNLPPGYENISVIPDNHLYRIPIELLPTEKPDSPTSYGSAKYMIEDFHFQYYTSLKEYENNKRTGRRNTAKHFSAFAISKFTIPGMQHLPSLPYATIEVNNIEQTLTSLPSKNIYTGHKATKEAFKKELSDSKIVHVATHSEVSERDPLFSTIYLNSESEDDSLESSQALYAYELFDTPFNSEFVMLNSCSSGSGNYLQGTGIIGITRALRHAGAKSLALNLWSVNDKVAAEFATDFYRHINLGNTKSEAMRLAKLNQLKTNNANPHYWGAYMLIGNPSPVTEKPSKPILLFSILALTVLTIGYTSKNSIALS